LTLKVLIYTEIIQNKALQTRLSDLKFLFLCYYQGLAIFWYSQAMRSTSNFVTQVVRTGKTRKIELSMNKVRDVQVTARSHIPETYEATDLH
jgi:hypothetical protein